MSDFNPQFQNQPDQFLGYSRGYQGDTSVADLFQNSGNLIKASAQTTDEIIKMNIGEEARQKVEPIRDAVTHALETGQLAASYKGTGDNVDVPTGVSDGLDRIEKLGRGKDSGALGESHYWNLLDAEARRLRAQHPGYKDYVDQRISELAGGTPANRMVQELYAEQRAGAGAVNKEYDYWEKKAVEQGQAPDIEQRKREGRPYTVGQLREKVATYQAQESQIRVSRERMADELQQGKVIKERVSNQAAKEVGYIVNNTLQAGVGQYDQAIDVLNKAAQKQQAGGTFSPTELDTLRTTIGALETTVDQKIAKVFTQIDPATKLRYADHLDNKEMEQIATSAKMPLTAMKEAIFNKDYGTVGSIVSRMQANIDNDTNNIYKNSVHAAKIMQLQKFYGNQWTALVLGQEGGKAFKDVMTKSIFEDSMFRTMDPDPSKRGEGFSDEIEKLRQANADPSVYRKAIDTHISILASNKPDPKMFEKSALIMFGPGNSNMFFKTDANGNKVAQFSDPYSLYQRIASDPNIAKNIIASNNPELINNYTRWVGQNFQTMMEPAAESAKRLAINSRAYNLEFNPQTLQFQVTPTGLGGPTIPAVNPFGLSDQADRFIFDPNSRKAVDNINSVLSGMTNLIKAKGGNPQEELPKLVQQLGIPDNPEKQPTGITSLWNAMMSKLNLSQVEEGKAPEPTKVTGTLTPADRAIAPLTKFIAKSPYGTYAAGRDGRVAKNIDGIWHYVQTDKNGNEVILEPVNAR